MFLFIFSGCLESRLRQIVHVSLFGKDTRNCGSTEKPCRTIAKAVARVAWGGRVIFNGKGTGKQPYDCKRITAHAHHPGIRVTRNVTMTSLPSTQAHVTCQKGFHFHRSNERLRITLSNITFIKTPLKFRDCSHVEIINCNHRDTHTAAAVAIRVQNSSKVNVTVRDSLFHNNSLCVKVLFEQPLQSDVGFSLSIYETKFLKNGLYTTSLSRGVIIFSNETNFSRKIHLHVTADQVTCTAGGGHFLNVDLPTAVTTETYNNDNLERNHFIASRSLYYSRVKIASVAFFRLRCGNNSEVRCVTVQSFTKANRTVDLSVGDSRFYDNRTNRTRHGAILRVTGTEAQCGTINISNTSFARNYRLFAAVDITPNFKVRLDGVRVVSSTLGVRMVSYDKVAMNESDFYLDVSIDKCIFLNNLNDLYGLLNNSVEIRFRVTNTIFDGKRIQEKDSGNSTFGIRVIVPPESKTIFSHVDVGIENVTFVGRPANSIVLVAKGNKTVTVRNCKFLDSFSLEKNEWRISKLRNLPDYTTGQGVLMFAFDSDELVDRGCVNSGVRNNTHPKWNYSSRVLFEDTLFQNNFGHVAGAIQIINGYVKFRRCNFTDNFAISDTGHVYVGYGSAKVEFKSCIFKRTRRQGTFKGTPFCVGRFLHSESGGPVQIKNTSFATSISQRLVPQRILRILSGGYFDMDLNSTIQCPTGSSLRFDNYSHFHYDGGQENTFCRINVTTEIFTCRMCPPGMYVLQSGFSRGLMVPAEPDCIKCPFGADCNGPNNISAKPDFWGYKITNASNFSSLAFLPCPAEYCRKPTNSSYHEVYNSCYGNRSGILCGRCAPGFSEALFSSECRKSEECRWNYLLWLFMAFYTIGLTVYLLKKPPLVRILKNQMLRFRRERHHNLHEGPVHGKEDPENGYVKIIFYFYQVVDLLSTNPLEDMMAQVPYISTIVAAFNFQVHIVDEGIDCPFAGLTAVTKEIFLSALVFAAIAHVFVIYCLHLAVNLTLKRGKPLLVHYVAVAMEIMLLGYERLAETSLKLMHCVPIDSELHLYYDGNIVCWQWWQYGILAFNIIFVFPFVGVLYWGSGKLYNKTISWKEFAGACVVPLPFIVYWLVKRSCARQSGLPDARDAFSCEYTSLLSPPAVRRVSRAGGECSDEITSILHGPFRAPSAHDQGTLYWESVLIGRRLVLLTFRAFIPNSMICFLCMSVACVLMLAHHLIKKPYRDRAADRLETLSLITLSCIAIINVSTATLASSAILPERPNKRIMVVLQWIQVGFLCVAPAVVALLILFALLSQLVRFSLFLKRKICCRFLRAETVLPVFTPEQQCFPN